MSYFDFDDDGHILKIVDLDGSEYKPGDKYWEWVKLKSRSAAFIKATFIDLSDMHSVVGNLGAWPYTNSCVAEASLS